MGHHLVDGHFQSDKFPGLPPGKVAFSLKDPVAQPFLWQLAEAYLGVDKEFAEDLQAALRAAGYRPAVAICFSCQPQAVLTTRATFSPVPVCCRCGELCTGGHWLFPAVQETTP